MAKAPARSRRPQDKFAMGRSLLVLVGLALLAAACTGQLGWRTAATAGAWDDDDNGMQRRQAAMLEAVKLFSAYNRATTPPGALKRAAATVNGVMAPLQPMFKDIGRMPETTAAEARAKEEARAELLRRHLGQLLPGVSIEITREHEQGRTLAHLSGAGIKTTLHFGDL